LADRGLRASQRQDPATLRRTWLTRATFEEVSDRR
jgi:hypothetical protein